MPSRWLPLLQRIHTEINMALWASLIALLAMLAIFVAPDMHAIQTRQQSILNAKISAENDHYCRRWGFTAGTTEYRSCLDDLWQLRQSIADQAAQDSLLF